MFAVFTVFLFCLCLPVESEWKPQDYSVDVKLGVMFRRFGSPGTDQCKLCMTSDDCIELNSVRCEYYMDTSKLLPEKTTQTFENKDPQLRAEVDSMLFSIIEKYYENENELKECIPYVSKYTDCTKETICTGCKTCDCDGQGRWNCTVLKQCRPELVTPVADQRTLAMVLEKLKGVEPTITRLKRSLDSMYHAFDDENRHYKLNEWMHSEPTLKFDFTDQNYIKQKKIEPKVTEYEYYYQHQHKTRRPNLEPSKTMNRSKNDTKLLNLIVNTIIEDTLPQVFKENVQDFENNRVKRDVFVNNTDVMKEGKMFSYAEISDWLNYINPYASMEINNKTADSNKTNMNEDTVTNMIPSGTSAAENLGFNDDSKFFNTNPEYLAFEEVYNNIAVDNKNYSRRKPLLDHELLGPDINIYDENYYYEENQEGQTEKIANNIKNLIDELGVTVPPEFSGVTEDITDYYLETVTEVVVDLLASSEKNNLDGTYDKDNREVNNKIDTPHVISDYPNTANIMKRDVSTVNEVENESLRDTNTTVQNITSSLNVLKEDILDPIGKMVDNKRKEMSELLSIRNKLITFIHSNNDSNFTGYGKASLLPLYQVEFLPHHYEEIHHLHKNNVTMLETYLEKLKRDVYEVIRDIVSIRKLYNNTSKMPDNLKFLIKALKHYVHRQGNKYERKTNFRRSYTSHDSIKSTIVEILETLLGKKINNNALEPLSTFGNTIIQRIIEKNYGDEFAASGLKIYDPEYNLTNDLKLVGTKWHVIAEKIDQSSVYDLLYNVKQLHLTLSVDIAKMHDALSLIDFAKSRRMVPVNGMMVNNIMRNINKGIIWMKNILFPISDGNDERMDISDSKPSKIHIPRSYKKKEPFITQIKNLLRKSKKGVLNFIHKKIPKSDIIKKMTRRKMEDMNNQQLEDLMTMQKWQTNLNIVRKKRTANINRLNRRIKDIIPKYLRGKVSPMAMKKGKNKKKNMTLGYKNKFDNSTVKVNNLTAKLETKATVAETKTTLKSNNS